MIVHYRKTQVSAVIIGVAGAGIIILGNIMWAYGCSWALWLPIILLTAVMVLFSTLTVEVGEDAVTAHFGLGFPKRRIPLRAIEYVRPMEMPWYLGWGVRWVPRGWMFRGSGTAVVGIALENGRRFCIGSPEPEALAKAIDHAKGRGNG